MVGGEGTAEGEQNAAETSAPNLGAVCGEMLEPQDVVNKLLGFFSGNKRIGRAVSLL